MTTLHVVMGSSGEYSDRKEWLVAAYVSESEARKHVLALEEAVRAFYALTPDERIGLAQLQTGNEYASYYTHPLDRPVGKGEQPRWYARWEEADRYWLETVELREVCP